MNTLIKRYVLLDLQPRYFHYLWPYRGQLGVTLLTMLGVAALEVALPWPLKYIVDNVVGGAPFTDPVGRTLVTWIGNDPRVLAGFFGLAIILLTALNGVLLFVSEYLKARIQARTTFQLRSDAFAHVQRLSLHFHDRSRIGEIINRVTNDAGRITGVLVGSTSAFVVNVFKFAGIVGVMLFVNWRFSVIALAYAPLLLFMFNSFRRNIKDSTRVARTEEGRMISVTQEAVSAIRVVQAFGREGAEQRRFEQHGEAVVQAELRATRWEAAFTPMIDVIKACGTAAILWYGVAQIFAGQLTVGELTVFLAYLATFYSPLTRLSRLAGSLQKAAVSGDRLAELLDNDEVIHDRPDARRLKRAHGAVTFDRVSFQYDQQPILHDISFSTLPGQIIGLVGSTGAGKTTVASLLPRFYDVQSGQITLDGINVQHIRLRDLRQQFALVPQEPLLFAASIYDNIAYGRPEASADEIVAAARAANAHEFILRLPHGYDTLIGERGVTLSGGQRQRIAIARAVLKNAPVLILDEPTAALDAAAEREVMEALERLMQGRTTFIIAHRLSTIRDADMILVLEHGRIVERGRHDQLLAHGGTYAALVRLQQSGGVQPLIAVPG